MMLNSIIDSAVKFISWFQHSDDNRGKERMGPFPRTTFNGEGSPPLDEQSRLERVEEKHLQSISQFAHSAPAIFHDTSNSDFSES